MPFLTKIWDGVVSVVSSVKSFIVATIQKHNEFVQKLTSTYAGSIVYTIIDGFTQGMALGFTLIMVTFAILVLLYSPLWYSALVIYGMITLFHYGFLCDDDERYTYEPQVA